MDPVKDMVDWLLTLTGCGRFGWSSGADKETYAVMNQTKPLSFMGSSVMISVILDPINSWQPVIRVDRLIPCSGGGYYQELFQTRYSADSLLAAIHWSWKKNSQEALKSLDPNAPEFFPYEKVDRAAKELASQLKKIGEGK